MRDADLVHEFDRAVARGTLAEALVNLQRFAELVADRKDRIERRHRLLKDHGDPAAAEGAHRLVADFGQIDRAVFAMLPRGVVVVNRAVTNAARMREQPHDGH